MAKRTDKIANVLRAFSIVTTVASLLWAVYATTQRNEAESAKQTMEAVLLQQAEALIDAKQQISRLQGEIVMFENQLDSLLIIADQAAEHRDSILTEIAYRDYIIENLKEQIDEDITIIDADDDEQLRIFLEWTEID